MDSALSSVGAGALIARANAGNEGCSAFVGIRGCGCVCGLVGSTSRVLRSALGLLRGLCGSITRSSLLRGFGLIAGGFAASVNVRLFVAHSVKMLPNKR